MNEIMREFLIFGKVQGVGYRRFVKSKAESRHNSPIVGCVENLKDGSVRVIARGDEESLEILKRYLEVGPIRCQVSRIETRIIQESEWKEKSYSFEHFEIIE